MLQCLSAIKELHSHKIIHHDIKPENILICAFYMVILGEMDPKVAKLVNLAQIWTCRLLKKPLICQWYILDGPESPESLFE